LKPKPPDYRLTADVLIDRSKLLGLNARQRPKPEDDDLRWQPPVADTLDDDVVGSIAAAGQPGCSTAFSTSQISPAGRIENPSYTSRRPRGGVERAEYDNDRLIEIAFAKLDAQNGFRHSVRELFNQPSGAPGHPRREPWKPPQPKPDG
jgi:hypothetical protein